MSYTILMSTTQFNKGTIEICILSLIDQKDRYGYELVDLISQHLTITESTVYPILRRLTKEKFCEAYLKESSEGPTRKYYKITPSGRERTLELTQQWMDFSTSINTLLQIKDTHHGQRKLS